MKKTKQDRGSAVGIYLRPSTERQVAMRGNNRSHVIARDLERLYTLYQRAIREVKLTDKEACLIADALLDFMPEDVQCIQVLLWAKVEDAIKLDNLAEQWGVDGPALVEKLRSLNALQAMAIVDAVERIWDVKKEGEEITTGEILKEKVHQIFNIIPEKES